MTNYSSPSAAHAPSHGGYPGETTPTAVLDYPPTIDYRQRAENGAAYLDQHFDSWVHDIDLEALDLMDCGKCVLGQEFGNYYTGLGRLGLDRLPEVMVQDFGFTLPSDEDAEGWDALTAAWVEVISERIDAKGV